MNTFKLFQSDLGAPLVQNGVAIGFLSEIISRNLAIFINLHKTYSEIIKMRKTRVKWPNILRIPRSRVIREQYCP